MIERGNMQPEGWQLVAPIGEFPHEENNLVQVIDARAVQSMHARFQQERETQNRAGLLVDYDHHSYDTERTSTAAGWIVDTQARADGLWACIKWTPSGATDVSQNVYRFLSPTWLPADCESLGKRRIRPLRLDSAALTNKPRIAAMSPLTNRRTEFERADMDKNTKPVLDNKKSLIEQQKALVAKIQREEKLDFEPAWELAQLRHPEFFVDPNPEADSNAETEESDAKEQERAVRQYQNRQRCSFEEAWNVVSAQRPEIFRNRVDPNLPPTIGGNESGANAEIEAKRTAEEFLSALREVASLRGTWHEAFLTLSREQPDLYQRAQIALGF